MNSQKGQPVAIASPTMHLVETRERLSELFALHHRRVLMAAYRITGSMADAEDVAQSVFLRLAGSDEYAVTNAGSYLYRAAINGGLDLLGGEAPRQANLWIWPRAWPHKGVDRGLRPKLRVANWCSGCARRSVS